MPANFKPFDKNEWLRLEKKADELRRFTIQTAVWGGSGHLGGSMSAMDAMTILYHRFMKVDVKEPNMADRDRFILSKGHCAPGLYSALAYKGFFPVEDLPTLRHIDSYLQGHPNMNTVPGIDMSTGSLGQGISTAVGMAKGAKYIGKNDINIYTLLGDGEIEEGQVWEALMFANQYKLDNLCVIIDFKTKSCNTVVKRFHVIFSAKTF